MKRKIPKAEKANIPKNEIMIIAMEPNIKVKSAAKKPPQQIPHPSAPSSSLVPFPLLSWAIATGTKQYERYRMVTILAVTINGFHLSNFMVAPKIVSQFII